MESGELKMSESLEFTGNSPFSRGDLPFLKGVLVNPLVGIPGTQETAIALSNLIDPLDWGTIFGNNQPVEVDLGCGDGCFLTEYAQAHPQTNFLGTERLMGRLNKIIRKGYRLGIANLKVSRVESGYFMKYLVPEASLSAIHLYFPDPWPKKRHARHRLVQAEFAQSCFRAMTPTGVTYLRTDNVEYYEQMREVFGNEPRLREVETPELLKKFQTDFEKQWLAQGLPTHYAAYMRK